jgi:C-terminal processing protease CtpA/Prc
VGEDQTRDRTVSPATVGEPYTGKVAILIGGTVMSSAESFVLMLRAAPRSRTFGETTAGSSGNPQPVDLGNGVKVFVPSWRCLLPDGTLLEGRGVIPDEAVPLGADASKDDVLEAAVKWLR